MIAMISENLIREITEAVGGENVLASPEELLCYSYDATMGFDYQPPEIVVFPLTRDHVVAVMKLAAKYKTPVYTRGAGTNLSCGTVPLSGGIVLSMLRMDKILEIDTQNLTATVEPGVVIQTLINTAKPHGLVYAPDPSSYYVATMGGSVAECSGGLRGLKYGVTKDYVMGLEAVFADGTVARFGGKTVKNVTGLDVKGLLVGSEGTLAIITEIIVKLVPLPTAQRAFIASFTSLEDAGSVVNGIIENRIIPATLEIMDNMTIRMVEEYKKCGLPTDAEAVLLIEVDGTSEEGVLKEAAIVEKVLSECNCHSFRIARTEAERDDLWAARRAALPALVKLRPTTILEDATVPRSQVAGMIRSVMEISKKHGLQIGTFGHAGDGNLHPTILCDASDPEEMARVKKGIDEIFAEALRLGGTLSGEHGIGAAKIGYMEWEAKKEGLDVMRKIKRALDPDNLLNPGKLIPMEQEGAQ